LFAALPANPCQKELANLSRTLQTTPDKIDRTGKAQATAIAYLQCVDPKCARRYPLESKEYKCAACAGLLDVQYDFPAVEPDVLRQLWHKRTAGSSVYDQSGVWRFREMLPFVSEGKSVVSLSEGRTPLADVTRTGEWVGGVSLSIKHQGNNPTGSFKDL